MSIKDYGEMPSEKLFCIDRNGIISSGKVFRFHQAQFKKSRNHHLTTTNGFSVLCQKGKIGEKRIWNWHQDRGELNGCDWNNRFNVPI
jgi:hypothetical protein